MAERGHLVTVDLPEETLIDLAPPFSAAVQPTYSQRYSFSWYSSSSEFSEDSIRLRERVLFWLRERGRCGVGLCGRFCPTLYDACLGFRNRLCSSWVWEPLIIVLRD